MKSSTFRYWRTAYGVAMALTLHTGRRHRVYAVNPYPRPFHILRRWRVREVGA